MPNPNPIALALLLLAASPAAEASLAVYVGKDLTKDGSVLLAGFGDEPSSHWLTIVPRRRHPAGSEIAAGGGPASRMPGEPIRIPQVPETHRYISMDYSYYSGLPAPLTNGGMNEHGLAVRDVALFSRRELVETTPNPQRGLNYSDIARIALERARTEREAIDISVDLIEKHGDFTYGGNSHVFADPNEGWVLLTFAGGKGLWVAKRLGPGDVWLNWRGYTGFGYVQDLPRDFRDNADYLASKNFVSFATQQGWYTPDGKKPFPSSTFTPVRARPARLRRWKRAGPRPRSALPVRWTRACRWNCCTRRARTRPATAKWLTCARTSIRICGRCGSLRVRLSRRRSFLGGWGWSPFLPNTNATGTSRPERRSGRRLLWPIGAWKALAT